MKLEKSTPQKGKGKKELRLGVSNLLPSLKHYIFDFIGLLLMTLALVTFLGLLHITKGGIVNWWSELVTKGFGWASYFFIALLIYMGILTLFRHIEHFPKIDLAKILFIESFLFCLSAILAIWGGFSIDRAILGKDGGVIGWGIARIVNTILPLPIALITLVVFSVVFLLFGLSNFKNLIDKLDVNLGKYSDKYSHRSTFIKERKGGSGELKTGKEGVRHARYKPGTADNLAVLNQKREKELPPLSILLEKEDMYTDESFVRKNAIQIEKTLGEFGMPARIVGYRVGPTVVQFALEPGYIEKVSEQGQVYNKKVRVSQISALKQDLALALSAERLRIEAPIPGYSYIGIEVPSQRRSIVRLRPILETNEFKSLNSPLGLALGLDVSGKPVIADLSRMPHLLISGTTGSGKSICIASIITCLIMNNTPEKLHIAIMDPKMVELARFNGLPHLLGKVETEPKRMLAVLSWAITEMERRFKMLESVNARGLDAYNLKMRKWNKKELPRIVIFIDELADLMISYPEKTESSLVRLAQMARATGINLVLTTQRPSTDIITGLIKANFPARISFMVATSTDSRVILDASGAETLMGSGDMLFLDPDYGELQRIQGVMVDDVEIEHIINYWQKVEYSDTGKNKMVPWEEFTEVEGNAVDDLFDKSIALIKREGRANISLLQRRLRIGYPRAARLMDELENQGIVGPPVRGGKDREVLIDNGINEE